jgi:2,4-dienoyl-CoA reductase-like NADH-dependent reductase (Old Yellow Enzyme family)
LKHSKLFAPLALLPDLVLRNRVVMAPMTTWASNDDGTVSDEENAYYRRRFSPHSNRGSDQWGGSLENRMRFPLAVVRAVKRSIAEHADRPFALGYRISVEESIDGGLAIADSLQLVTRLVDAGANYIHASLGSVLDQKPTTGGPDATIVSILRDHLDACIPLMAAGRIKTPAQAEDAMDMGLSTGRGGTRPRDQSRLDGACTGWAQQRNLFVHFRERRRPQDDPAQVMGRHRCNARLVQRGRIGAATKRHLTGRPCLKKNHDETA